jgi:hypothetical protein
MNRRRKLCHACTAQAKENPTQSNTIVLKLKVECKRLPDGTVENDKVRGGCLAG